MDLKYATEEIELQTVLLAKPSCSSPAQLLHLGINLLNVLNIDLALVLFPWGSVLRRRVSLDFPSINHFDPLYSK